jgi:hypothetical protein
MSEDNTSQEEPEPSEDASESHPQTPEQEAVTREVINLPQQNWQSNTKKFGV